MRHRTAECWLNEPVLRPQVEKLVEVIRPALQADKGDIVLHDVDEESGVVTVELTGACVGCPASTQTMKAGIERIMRDRVDGVTAVVNLSDDAIIGGALPDGVTESPFAPRAHSC